MRMHRNHRSKLLYGLILAMTVAIGLNGLRVSQALSDKLADASYVAAPALGEAALVERQVGTVQARLDAIVTAAARHEMQNAADQVKYLAGRHELMIASLDRIQQGRHTDEVGTHAARVRTVTSD